MARSKKDKNLELGSSALNFSHFDIDYKAAQQKLKQEIEEKLKEEKLKSLERKKKFEFINTKFKEAYTDVIMTHVPCILEKFGINIPSDLTVVLKEEVNIEILNRTGTFKSVLEKEDKLLMDIAAFLSEREDICLEVKKFVEKRNID